MTRRISLLGILLCVAWPVVAAAQTQLTLSDAVTAALNRNAGLRAAHAETERADAEVTVARGAWWPRLTMAESWQRGDQPVFAFGALLSTRRFTAADFAVSRLNAPGATNVFSTRVTVGQLVFDGGRTSSVIAGTVAQRDVARAESDAALAQVAVSVTRTFGQILIGQSQARATDSAVAAAIEDLARAERRRDAGTVTDADVLAVSVHLSEMRQRRLQVEQELAIARAQLNRLMGAPVEASVDAALDVVADLPVPAASRDLATLFSEAEAARPELRRADAQMRATDAAERQARSIWWPQIFAQAGLEWNGLRAGDQARSWVIGGEARWTLSLSGADAARVRAASAARSAASAQLEDLRAAVRVDVLTAARQLDTAIARTRVGADAVKQSEERARVVRNRYDAGLASMTDVLAAAASTLDAESRRVTAAVDALVAGAELQRALGRPAGK